MSLENVRMPSDFFTRPADIIAYTAGDLVANSTVPGEVEPLRFPLQGTSHAGGIQGAVRHTLLHKTTANSTGASFALYLFMKPPVSLAGDNEPFAVESVQDLLTVISIDMANGVATSSDMAAVGNADPDPYFRVDDANKQSLYGLLVAVGGYEPGTGEKFTLKISAEA